MESHEHFLDDGRFLEEPLELHKFPRAVQAIVPATALDVVALLMRGAVGEKKRSPTQLKRLIRQWLQTLVKANVMMGSVEGGVSVHDLVRDCMVRRANASRAGGMGALQRQVLPLLLSAYGAGGSAAACV